MQEREELSVRYAAMTARLDRIHTENEYGAADGMQLERIAGAIATHHRYGWWIR